MGSSAATVGQPIGNVPVKPVPKRTAMSPGALGAGWPGAYEGAHLRQLVADASGRLE
jgi:hypothetical protein